MVASGPDRSTAAAQRLAVAPMQYIGVIRSGHAIRDNEAVGPGGDTAAPARPHPGIAGRGASPRRPCLVPHRFSYAVLGPARPRRPRRRSAARVRPCRLRSARSTTRALGRLVAHHPVPLGSALHRYERLLLLDVPLRSTTSAGQPQSAASRPPNPSRRPGLLAIRRHRGVRRTPSACAKALLVSDRPVSTLPSHRL